jgi:hypothetical protein
MKTDPAKRTVGLELTISNCMDCPYCEEISDPDPYDFFCSNDVAFICKKSPMRAKPKSPHLADHKPFRKIVSGCRPYGLRKQTLVPKWCPLIKVGKGKRKSTGKRVGTVL